MKRRFALFNLMLMAVVLLTTAYQSFHAFSHVAKSHGCEHSHKKQEKHFGSHHEHDDDDCHICDFHFDFFVAPQQFCLRLDFPFYEIGYRFSSIEAIPSFTGSLFSLRGPPSV